LSILSIGRRCIRHENEAVNAYNPITEDEMQYLLALYIDESSWGELTPEQQKKGTAAYAAYTEALQSAGALINSNRLRPSTTATTLRTVNGKAQVLDGPFAESKEQLAGYYLIDAPDLDGAMQWAGRCPAAQHGIVEVRAIWTM
jgi:hypothetical protein